MQGRWFVVCILVQASLKEKNEQSQESKKKYWIFRWVGRGRGGLAFWVLLIVDGILVFGIWDENVCRVNVSEANICEWNENMEKNYHDMKIIK